MSGDEKTPRPRTADDYCDAGMASYPLGARILLLVCSALVWLFSKIYWHWTVEGPVPFGKREAGERGRVIICNHASMLDPALLVIYPSLRGSHIRPLYKSELDGAGIAQWFLSRVGALPIKRGTADMKAIRRAVNAIKRGEDVLIFPEGTRVRDAQARPELHGGFALIAQMAGASIVPCAIDGTERICPSGHGFLRPSRVYLRFGEPVSLEEVAGLGRREQSEALERIAMGRVYEMRSELRERRYGKQGS